MTQKLDKSEHSKVSRPQDRPGARVLSAAGEGKRGVRVLGKHVKPVEEQQQ